MKCRLNPEQTQAVIGFARRKPFENADSIIGDGKAVLGLNPIANSIAVYATSFAVQTRTNFSI
jgi:eukaryotic translation initiation factor 2C